MREFQPSLEDAPHSRLAEFFTRIPHRRMLPDMGERPSLPDMGERLSLPALGDVVLGKYSIIRVLGEGAMGIVFEAVHTRLGQRVAIKMLRPSHGHLREIRPRFEREARAAAQLQSAHVARVIDVDVLPNGTPFMVMEYLEGHDLAAELNARGPLPIDEAVTYILQVCQALGEAHRLGIVHRDIKPANLFLAQAGERRIIKVLDFGISKMPAGDAEADVTATFSTFGTPLYMSPEQMRSAKYVDGRTDIWAIGVVLYQLLTGRLPFDGESAIAIATSVATDSPPPLRAFRPDVPADLERAVFTALVKDREHRFQHVEAFAREIAPFGCAADPEPALFSAPATSANRPATSSGAPAVSTVPARSATRSERNSAPPMHNPDPLASTMREGRHEVRALADAIAASRSSVPSPAELPPEEEGPLTIPGLKKTSKAVIATSIVLGVAVIGGLTALLLSTASPTDTAQTPSASASVAPEPPVPSVSPVPPPATTVTSAPPVTPVASSPSKEDKDAGSSGEWVDIGDRIWRASPLKNPNTGKPQGFPSFESAQNACSIHGARVPSPGDISKLTKPNSSGQREIDLDRIKPFGKGGIPVGFYWVADGSRRSIQGRAITQVTAEDGQWYAEAFVLCVKNR